ISVAGCELRRVKNYFLSILIPTPNLLEGGGGGLTTSHGQKQQKHQSSSKDSSTLAGEQQPDAPEDYKYGPSRVSISSKPPAGSAQDSITTQHTKQLGYYPAHGDVVLEGTRDLVEPHQSAVFSRSTGGIHPLSGGDVTMRKTIDFMRAEL
ncbi:unnamed protein product, partial [Amoebophrya sp. A25]